MASVAEQISELSAVYEAAELRILDLIATRLKKGADAPDWAMAKLLELATVHSAIEKDLGRIAPSTADRISKLMKASYDQGTQEALRALSLPSAPALPAVPSRPMSRLLRETTEQVLLTHQRVLRASDDIYRSVIREASGVLVLGTGTRVDAIQDALNRFADAGVTGFTDRRGRNWQLSSYVEMAVGTASHRASTQGHLEKLEEQGHDLVVVSDHMGECPICRPWEGKVLSLGYGDGEHPTVEDARARGLEHPGCRHRYGIWIEGVSKRPEPQGKPSDHEARSRQRAIERQIRAWKRREAAGDPTAKAKIREWQKRMRDHLEANPTLKRQPGRERLPLAPSRFER